MVDKSLIKQTEERQFFRVDGDVVFAYLRIPEKIPNWQVPEEEVTAALFNADEYRYYLLMRELHELDNQANKVLTNISRDMPELLNYCQINAAKINALGHALSASSFGEMATINLSIGGLAFPANEPIEENTRLKIKCIFPKTGLGFVATASVVLCRHLPKRDSENPYLISGKFFDLSTTDEHIIQRHILQAQIPERNTPQ